jgi:hypothetical protein
MRALSRERLFACPALVGLDYCLRMNRYGLTERARRAQLAQAEVHAAFSEMTDRRDAADPRTVRWLDAIARFRYALAQALPTALRDVFEGDGRIADLDTDDVLEFLDADPLFRRSGYIKERLLREIKGRPFSAAQAERFRDIILRLVQTRDCREFRYYCAAAAAVDDEGLRGALAEVARSDDAAARRRAGWMLAALDHARRSKVGRGARPNGVDSDHV